MRLRPNAIFPTLATRASVPQPDADKLRNAYLWYRYGDAPHQVEARAALAAARLDIAAGRTHYAPRCALGYQPAFNGAMRYVEDCDRAGLRRVGYADELARIGHEGWFTEDDGAIGEVLRGVVYQLPARHGCALYVPGYANPWNDGICFDFGACVAGERLESSWDNDDDAKAECARVADSMAERAAEEERDYQRAWAAGNAYAEAGEERALKRATILELCAMRRVDPGSFGLRTAICDAWERACELARLRCYLRDGSDDTFYWNPGDEAQRAAFHEGASR